MKRLLLSLALGALLFVPSHLRAQQNETYLQYIAQWRDVAVDNQENFGIPASIIMAQALLESAAGTSELAQNANNHFGIKCTSDWTGKTYHKDDDRKDDCFRVYRNAAESFADHSRFLQRSRYQSLYEIAIEDYEAWAEGLKRCGYATDPKYPQKLTKLIEDYRLDLLADRDWTPASNTGGDATTKRAVVVTKKESAQVAANDIDPNYVEPLTARQEKKLFLLTHKPQRKNGVKYVVAKQEDTYASIAFRMNVTERSLREWNDALGRTLRAGEWVYLSNKKKQAPKDREAIWVMQREPLWDVCQREGVQMKKVQKYNDLDPAVRVFKMRQKIYLRKPKK